MRGNVPPAVRRTTFAVAATLALGTEAATQSACEAWNTEAFFAVADAGDTRECLATGADSMARDADHGWTPLHMAARRGSAGATLALIEARADPNARNVDGTPPLHMAAALNPDPEIVAALLRAGADANANGATPVHLAALLNGNPAIAEALIAAEASPLLGLRFEEPRTGEPAEPQAHTRQLSSGLYRLPDKSASI